MNKIYCDQIEKANMLVAGLKKNAEFLKTKGYDLSIIERLEVDCQEMEKEGMAIAEEEKRLSEHRSQCHAILARLKEHLLEGKSGIKNRFEQDQWLSYGVPDKR